jgi:hypothetical protein
MRHLEKRAVDRVEYARAPLDDPLWNLFSEKLKVKHWWHFFLQEVRNPLR